MKGNKKPTSFFLLSPSICFSAKSPGIAQTTQNKGQEPLTVVENCQGKSNQWPKHKETCRSEMELAAKLPGFRVFLVTFKTYIEKKCYGM